MRILFAGTPAIATPALRALVEAGHRVEVLTNPDAPVGRSSTPVPSPVKVAATALGLVVHQPPRLDAEARALFDGRFDLLTSFAYGRLFGPKFLALFPQGGVNVHPSLLPRWRGPSPLTAALLARDSETGISVQRLALEMDCGDVLVQSRRPLDGTETTGSLTDWAADAAAPLLVDAVATLAAHPLAGRPQDPATATYCRLVAKDDGLVDWSRSAADLDAQVRAYDPWPGTFTWWKGQRLGLRGQRVGASPVAGGEPGRVLSVDKSKGVLVQTGDGLLALTELQLAGRKVLDFRSFLNGNPDLIGARLGDHP